MNLFDHSEWSDHVLTYCCAGSESPRRASLRMLRVETDTGAAIHIQPCDCLDEIVNVFGFKSSAASYHRVQRPRFAVCLSGVGISALTRSSNSPMKMAFFSATHSPGLSFVAAMGPLMMILLFLLALRPSSSVTFLGLVMEKIRMNPWIQAGLLISLELDIADVDVLGGIDILDRARHIALFFDKQLVGSGRIALEPEIAELIGLEVFL